MVADFSDDGIGSEAAVVEFERGTSGTDVPAKKPDELVGLIGRGRNDMAIEIFLLFILRVLEFGAKFFVNEIKALGEVSGSRDSGIFREFGLECGMEGIIGEEGGLFGGVVLGIIENKFS